MVDCGEAYSMPVDGNAFEAILLPASPPSSTTRTTQHVHLPAPQHASPRHDRQK